jgi:hypothetical protein
VLLAAIGCSNKTSNPVVPLGDGGGRASLDGAASAGPRDLGSLPDGQEAPPPAVVGLILSDSTDGDPAATPIASWTPAPGTAPDHYEAALFSHPDHLQLNAWTPTMSPTSRFVGTSLTLGSQYVFGVRAINDAGAGPTAFSPSFTVIVDPGVPTIVDSIALSSSTSPLTSTPTVSWQLTSYTGFQQYQVAIFSYPGYAQLNGWANTGQPTVTWNGTTLGDGAQYCAGIRIFGTGGTGATAFSPPWTARASFSPTAPPVSPSIAAGNDISWQHRLSRVQAWASSDKIRALIDGTAFESLFNTAFVSTLMNAYAFQEGQFNLAAREKVDCGAIPRGRLGVILIAGQSNAANTGQGSYDPRHRFYQLHLQDGGCYVARNPLLGEDPGEEVSPSGQNFAVQLADQLLDAGSFDNVLLVPIAVSGTYIEEWAPGGTLHERFDVTFNQLDALGLAPTYVLWIQGEANVPPTVPPPGYSAAELDEASTLNYEAHFYRIAQSLRTRTFAPIFIATASLCGGAPRPSIELAQSEVVDEGLGIYPGANIDSYGVAGRYLDPTTSAYCHLNATGIAEHATDWSKILQKYSQTH